MSFAELTASLNYPMFVVTAGFSGEVDGCLVGFATQGSIDPPRFLACLSRANRTYRVAERASALAVHALRRDQRELGRLFGEQTGDDVDKFAGCRWELDPAGPPVLLDCPARFVGAIVTRIPLGDHVGFLLDPLDQAGPPLDVRDWLGFQDVTDFSPGHPA
ncbi:MAG TPA: flavin reductase family protein [Mycobacteriales bacterium]|jgi:flavin reductase (DIM6/NTAB) family NADH-FMN oxidoreductase RutF|nr:flavin reductase family protein [Mycobacteriales bacterium]